MIVASLISGDVVENKRVEVESFSWYNFITKFVTPSAGVTVPYE